MKYPYIMLTIINGRHKSVQNTQTKCTCRSSVNTTANTNTFILRYPDNKNNMAGIRGHKPVQCPYCGKFYGLTYIAKHIKEHEGSTEPSEFTCDVCGRRFDDAFKLEVHMGLMHKSGR